MKVQTMQLPVVSFTCFMFGAWLVGLTCMVYRYQPKPNILRGKTGCYEPKSIKVFNDDNGMTTVSGTVVPCKVKQ